MSGPTATVPRLHRRRWPAAGALAVVLALLPATAALAAWTAASSGSAQARSQAMPAGPTPSVSVQGRNVTVSWPASTLPGGEAVSGYQVRRRLVATGALATIGAACNTVQSGLTCTETAVDPGSWSYGITPLLAQWTGTEGTRAPAIVGAPTFTRTSAATVTTLPATVTGTLANYVGPANLTFRLDNATSGPVLTGTPTTIAAGGAASVSITLPAGVAAGSHAIYAVGSGAAGDTASVTVAVDATPPTPTALVTTNGGSTVGLAEAGDSISVTFSQALRSSSLCSGWADDGTAKSITSGVTVTIENKGGAGNNDSLLVTAAGCETGGVRFGAIDLGAKGYIKNGTGTFGAAGTSSTIGWNPATATLTITLGTASGSFGTVSSSTALYTPDPAITNAGGLAVTGTASRTGAQL
jgi:hypothetical protein